MDLKNPTASFYVPDGKASAEALERVTHLGIGAHQDDLEVIAYHGIRRCREEPDNWFGGVVCTDGAGGPRGGRYAGCSADDMREIRSREQREAAERGRYSFVAQLGYPSGTVRTAPDLLEDLRAILRATQPRIVYTHNPADKHETHVGVCLRVIEALRDLPAELHPQAVYGCEVWRGLDWLQDEDKVALDVGGDEDLAASLLGVFRSQNEAGKNYVRATIGRWRSNATYHQPYAVDELDGACFAMELTPLVSNVSLDVTGYVVGHIERFRRDVEDTIKNRGGSRPR